MLAIKLLKLTDSNDIQFLNMKDINMTSGAFILLKSTDFKEVHPPKKYLIFIIKEKSKFVKSTIVIFSRFLNIFWQESNWVVHNNLIVFVSEVNSCCAFIFSAGTSISLICILWGKGLKSSLIIDWMPFPWIDKMIKLLVLNFLNSKVSEEDIIESTDIKAIKTIIDEVILNNAEFLII